MSDPEQRHSVDQAPASDTNCGRWACPRSQQGGKTIPQGLARLKACSSRAPNVVSIYCLRPACISSMQVTNMLARNGSFEHVAGMAELPANVRNAAIRCFESIRDGTELAPQLLSLLDPPSAPPAILASKSSKSKKPQGKSSSQKRQRLQQQQAGAAEQMKPAAEQALAGGDRQSLTSAEQPEGGAAQVQTAQQQAWQQHDGGGAAADNGGPVAKHSSAAEQQQRPAAARNLSTAKPHAGTATKAPPTDKKPAAKREAAAGGSGGDAAPSTRKPGRRPAKVHTQPEGGEVGEAAAAAAASLSNRLNPRLGSPEQPACASGTAAAAEQPQGGQLERESFKAGGVGGAKAPAKRRKAA